LLVIPGYIVYDNNIKRDFFISPFILTWSSDGEFLAFSANEEISLFNNEREFFYMKLSDTSIHYLGRFTFCDSPDLFYIHEYCINTPIDNDISFFTSFIFSNDNKYLSAYLSIGSTYPNIQIDKYDNFDSYNNTLLIWDLQSNELIHKYQMRDSLQDIGFQRNTIEFSNENGTYNFISLNRNRTDLLFHDIDNNNIEILYSNNNFKHSIQVSHNRSLIAFGSSETGSNILQNNGNLLIYNLETEKIEFSISHPNLILRPLDWSLNDNRLLIGVSDFNKNGDYKDKEILIWDFSENRFSYNHSIENNGLIRSWNGDFNDILYKSSKLFHCKVRESSITDLPSEVFSGTRQGFGRNVNLSPDGNLISFSWSEKISIRNIESGSIEKSYVFFEFEEEIGLSLIATGILLTIFAISFYAYKINKHENNLKRTERVGKNSELKAPLYKGSFNQN
jgi:hypothetical protein